jgi:hypothetical protein
MAHLPSSSPGSSGLWVVAVVVVVHSFAPSSASRGLTMFNNCNRTLQRVMTRGAPLAASPT